MATAAWLAEASEEDLDAWVVALPSTLQAKLTHALDNARTPRLLDAQVTDGVHSTVECTIVREAAARVFWPDGELWYADAEMSVIDRNQGAHLLRIKNRTLPALSEMVAPGVLQAADAPLKVAERSYNNFYTIVLATAMAGALRVSWATNFCAHLATLVPVCNVIRLVAVKGGAACDCEIRFIEALMESLGARKGKQAAESGLGFLVWAWFLERHATEEECVVCLDQFRTVEQAEPTFLASTFHTRKSEAAAPSLRRCMVVSAPIKGPPSAEGLDDGAPIAERLNANVADALAIARRRAELGGWFSRETAHAYQAHPTKSEIAASRSYRAEAIERGDVGAAKRKYFELRMVIPSEANAKAGLALAKGSNASVVQVASSKEPPPAQLPRMRAWKTDLLQEHHLIALLQTTTKKTHAISCPFSDGAGVKCANEISAKFKGIEHELCYNPYEVLRVSGISVSWHATWMAIVDNVKRTGGKVHVVYRTDGKGQFGCLEKGEGSLDGHGQAGEIRYAGMLGCDIEWHGYT